MAVRAVRKVKESFKKRTRHLTIHPKDEKVLQEGVTFKVEVEKICAKPRLSRSDVWRKRPIVQRWLVYKDAVAMNYRSQGGITYFQPVAITYDFWLKDNRKIDLDNLIKGVNDALNGLAWPDDSVKYIRYYEGARIVIDTSRVREQAIIRIRPAVKFIEEYKANNVLSL